ncbi:MAG TPA: hydroxyacylglutathione hydrolase [Rhodocyclaceae bacterium]|jgi:hydroxyacylglutathione hydrolase|nr:hydroxyacylglutathione hydrolase [Rhodocyclaceae bacterium]
MEIIRLRAFTDNYIWGLRHEGLLAVVDPGEATPVLDYLARSGDRLVAILLTHHHGDHIDGMAELCKLGDIEVFGPGVEEIAGVTQPLHGGETIALPGFSAGDALQVLSVPGHTRSHLAYYRPGALFCGDTLFTLGCGRVFDSTPAMLWQTLERITALPPETLVYCAHEYTYLNLPFALAVEPGNPLLQARAKTLREKIVAGTPTVPATLAAELETNVFLRPDSSEVIASVQRYCGHSGQPALASPVEIFTALRAWRNTFQAPSN